MKKERTRFLVIILLVILTAGCTGDTIFSESTRFEAEEWGRSFKPEFMPTVADTINGFNIDFFIRTGSAYPYRNIYLFITTITPSGSLRTDTIEYFLSSENGTRYGSGVGDVREVILPFRRNVRFSESGRYRFIIEQGMRKEDLTGLYDMGLVIKKYSVPK